MMIAKNPRQLLLDAVSGSVRKSLIRERARAMAGQLDEALSSLSRLTLHCCSAEDRVAIGMLRAELLDADKQYETALAVFDEAVVSERASVSEHYRGLIDRNSINLSMNNFRPIEGFYHLVDRERAQGVEWLDYESLFHALRDQYENKRYKSLPIMWRQLQEAYRSGSWFAQRIASGLFIDECLASHDAALATLHLLLARDSKNVSIIAEAVKNSRSVDPIRNVLQRIYTSANLKTHAALGCELLRLLADIIPEDEVPCVADWLFPRAALKNTAKLVLCHVLIVG